jgi:SAM-dependent methyltransferase
VRTYNRNLVLERRRHEQAIGVPSVGSAPSRLLAAIARAFLWPLRRFFDPRFDGVAHRIDAKHAEVVSRVDTGVAEITALRRESRQRHAESIQIAQALTDLMEGKIFREALSGSLEDIDGHVARLLNLATTHRGFAAQRGLWVNPPVSLCYSEGDVVHSDTNERIVEVPYVLRALATLDEGASILDVGAAESTLAVSLASLGYRVTALDIRPYPFTHPSLHAVLAPIQDWDENESFDAVVCVSTIEHVGLGAYGEPRGANGTDLAAMRRMRELTKPGGLLVLTIPVGGTSVDEIQRTYDRAGLEALLGGWEVEDLTLARRQDQKTWVLTEADLQSIGDEAGVALVTARATSGRA